MAISFISLSIISVLFLFFFIGTLQSQSRFQQLNEQSSKKRHYLRNITFANYKVNKPEALSTILTTFTGGGIIFGLVALTWRDGIIYYFAALAYACGLFSLYFLIGRIRRRSSGYASFEHFISNNNRFNVFLITCINLFIFIALLITQLVSLQLLLSSYFEPHLASIAFLATCFLIFFYVARYGFVGIVSTDKLQILGIICLFVFFGYFIVENTALLTAQNMQKMLRDYPNDAQFGWLFIIGVTLLFPWTAVCRQEYWQRIVACENEQTAKSAFKLTFVVFALLASVVFTLSLLLKAKYPFVEHSDSVVMNAVDEYESVIIITLFVVGLMLCLITSADSYLNSLLLSCLSAYRSVTYGELQNDKALAIAHSVLALLLFSGLMYYLSNYEVDLQAWFINSSGGAIILLPAFSAALLNRYNPLATSLSLIAGFSCILFSTLSGSFVQIAFFISFLLSVLCYFLGVIISRWRIIKVPNAGSDCD